MFRSSESLKPQIGTVVTSTSLPSSLVEPTNETALILADQAFDNDPWAFEDDYDFDHHDDKWAFDEDYPVHDLGTQATGELVGPH